MTTPAPPRRRWSRYSLRTLFVLVTIFGAGLGWLGVHLKWMRDRDEGLQWLDAHGVGGAICFVRELRPGLPWSLQLLGAKPLALRCIGALDGERKDLPAYRKRAAEIAGLFPECQIVDTDEHDWETEDIAE